MDEVPGGIDLNAGHLKMNVDKATLGGVVIPVFKQPQEDVVIDGFVPIIINVAPVNNILPLLGLGPETREEEQRISRM